MHVQLVPHVPKRILKATKYRLVNIGPKKYYSVRSQLHKFKSWVTSQESQVKSHKSWVTSQESRVKSHKSWVTSRVTSHESQVKSQESRVTSHESQVKSHESQATGNTKYTCKTGETRHTVVKFSNSLSKTNSGFLRVAFCNAGSNSVLNSSWVTWHNIELLWTWNEVENSH